MRPPDPIGILGNLHRQALKTSRTRQQRTGNSFRHVNGQHHLLADRATKLLQHLFRPLLCDPLERPGHRLQRVRLFAEGLDLRPRNQMLGEPLDRLPQRPDLRFSRRYLVQSLELQLFPRGRRLHQIVQGSF